MNGFQSITFLTALKFVWLKRQEESFTVKRSIIRAKAVPVMTFNFPEYFSKRSLRVFEGNYSTVGSWFSMGNFVHVANNLKVIVQIGE